MEGTLEKQCVRSSGLRFGNTILMAEPLLVYNVTVEKAKQVIAYDRRRRTPTVVNYRGAPDCMAKYCDGQDGKK